MLHLFIILLSCNKTVIALDLDPGIPVPHADILDQILSANVMNMSEFNDGSMFDFLLGNNTDQSSNKMNTENLDLNILDAENVKKIVDVARRKFENVLRQNKRGEALEESPVIINKAIQMMKQSIYSTRYRLEGTKQLRKKYHMDASYNVALLYGSLTQITYKMDNLFAQMKHFKPRTHFIWYLIIYEKILAAHVDVTAIVRRIFNVHNTFLERAMREPEDMGQEKNYK